jgi:hypothetical protein
VLGHDYGPQRLDTTTTPAKIGSIAGRHRHGWLLLLQTLDHDIRPSTARHILNLPPIHALVQDQHQRHAVATGRSCVPVHRGYLCVARTLEPRFSEECLDRAGDRRTEQVRNRVAGNS